MDPNKNMNRPFSVYMEEPLHGKMHFVAIVYCDVYEVNSFYVLSIQEYRLGWNGYSSRCIHCVDPYTCNPLLTSGQLGELLETVDPL